MFGFYNYVRVCMRACVFVPVPLFEHTFGFFLHFVPIDDLSPKEWAVQTLNLPKVCIQSTAEKHSLSPVYVTTETDLFSEKLCF